MLPTKFQVSWLLGLGKKVKNLGFPIRMILAIFDLPRCFLPSLEPIGLSVQQKRKIDFQDGGHLGFSIGTILATFGLQVIPILPTKYRINWPRGVGGVAFKAHDGRRTTDID